MRVVPKAYIFCTNVPVSIAFKANDRNCRFAFCKTENVQRIFIGVQITVLACIGEDFQLCTVQKFLQGGIIGIFGNLNGTQYPFAPEFTLPDANDRLIVDLIFEGVLCFLIDNRTSKV